MAFIALNPSVCVIGEGRWGVSTGVEYKGARLRLCTQGEGSLGDLLPAPGQVHQPEGGGQEPPAHDPGGRQVEQHISIPHIRQQSPATYYVYASYVYDPYTLDL